MIRVVIVVMVMTVVLVVMVMRVVMVVGVMRVVMVVVEVAPLDSVPEPQGGLVHHLQPLLPLPWGTMHTTLQTYTQEFCALLSPIPSHLDSG